MKKIENYNPREVGHLSVTGNGSKALFGMPNAKNETFEIETKIKFGMESVPSGKKGSGGVVEKTD